MAPATVICIGMAGSGKTTFMQRLNSHLHASKKMPYVVNLDPAVLKVPFGCNIDIRDSINYKKVMEDYQLGPNGAIVTSLNLFSTKVDQVIELIQKRSDNYTHTIVDTPGQIECFIWSASGAIITESLLSSFPTVILYVIDTPRTSSPTTFISNMLYACSILYKTKLPMIIVFNKTDLTKADFAKEWMTDFEKFQILLKEDSELSDETSSGSGYMASLVNSMSLMLEEFYSTLDVVSCSAYTGEGFDDFLEAVDKKVDEYNNFYLKEREEILLAKLEKEKKDKEKNLNHLMSDLGISKNKKENKDSVDVLSDFSDDDDEETLGLVERDEDLPEREYTFAEDRNSELTEEDQDLLSQYQQLFNKTSKSASSKTAENILSYMKQS